MYLYVMSLPNQNIVTATSRNNYGLDDVKDIIRLLLQGGDTSWKQYEVVLDAYQKGSVKLYQYKLTDLTSKNQEVDYSFWLKQLPLLTENIDNTLVNIVDTTLLKL